MDEINRLADEQMENRLGKFQWINEQIDREKER